MLSTIASTGAVPAGRTLIEQLGPDGEDTPLQCSQRLHSPEGAGRQSYYCSVLLLCLDHCGCWLSWRLAD